MKYNQIVVMISLLLTALLIPGCIPADEAGKAKTGDTVQVDYTGKLADGAAPQVGQQLRGTKSDGTTMFATIRKVSDATVTLDGNAPLAGKDLTFEIGLVKILPAP